MKVGALIKQLQAFEAEHGKQAEVEIDDGFSEDYLPCVKVTAHRATTYGKLSVPAKIVLHREEV